MGVNRHIFADRESQARALADAVADCLRGAIVERGRAALAVPGGTTPGAFLTALGGRSDIDWTRVTVTLTDERQVPATDERSNQRLVRETLLAAGAAPDFVPLCDPDGDLASVDAALNARALPLDAVVLGMGNDGHTASLFPGADRLDQALDPDGEAAVIALIAPGAPEPRISLTAPALLSASHLFVLIAGEDKRQTLDTVVEQGPVADAPIRAILNGPKPVAVYWAP